MKWTRSLSLIRAYPHPPTVVWTVVNMNNSYKRGAVHTYDRLDWSSWIIMHEESYDIKVYFCQIFVDGDGLWVCGCLSVCLFLFLCLLLSLCESASFCPTRELKNVMKKIVTP